MSKLLNHNVNSFQWCLCRASRCYKEPRTRCSRGMMLRLGWSWIKKNTNQILPAGLWQYIWTAWHCDTSSNGLDHHKAEHFCSRVRYRGLWM